MPAAFVEYAKPKVDAVNSKQIEHINLNQ